MEFFEKAVSKSKEYAKVVEQKAGEAYDNARTRYKIMETKNQISRRYEDIGKLMYTELKGSEKTAENTEIDGIVYELDMLSAELYTLEENLASLKGERLCTNCKASICKEDPYCRYCGAKME